jgi:uncharacterized membrane protein YcaP (DUF421 family)
MGIEWIWKSALIVLVGTLLLRLAGRKSISQMTIAQTVIMIAIGSLLIQPVAGKNIWTTFGVGTGLVVYLILVEYIQLKFDWFEKFVTGKSVILIQNGNLVEGNLKKLRLTVDQLEMQLRQASVTDMSDVHYATLEPNGKLAFVLTEQARNSSKRDIALLKEEISQLTELIKNHIGQPPAKPLPQEEGIPQQPLVPLFDEVQQKNHPSPPPKHLQ